MSQFKDDREAADYLAGKFNDLKQEIGKVIVGQHDVVDNLLISIFCRGHALLVGVPGLAKTLLISTLSETLDLDFSRIQFTPDLMPSDILGTEILDVDEQSGQKHLKFLQGPIFANIILADEINRTPPKTQAALLEAMQEKRVTVAGESRKLKAPFFVLATQNPIEQEGTYPLPEAQLDRFMFYLKVDYPSLQEEIDIVKATTGGESSTAGAVLHAEDILALQQVVRRVPVPDQVTEFAVKLVQSSRPSLPEASEYVKDMIGWGAGPRASQYLILGAKAHALLQGKYSPDIEDVEAIALPALRHRILPSFTAEADGITSDDIIRELIQRVR
ncbi:MAG: AAA family ATPase [Bacteroidota bacterium]